MTTATIRQVEQQKDVLKTIARDECVDGICYFPINHSIRVTRRPDKSWLFQVEVVRHNNDAPDEVVSVKLIPHDSEFVELAKELLRLLRYTGPLDQLGCWDGQEDGE